MKRYMVVQESFDATPNFLSIEIKETWTEETRIAMAENQAKVMAQFVSAFGTENSVVKLKNYQDIGIEPMSVISYHNRFFRQCTHAFIMQAYYPALTGVCSLGERILNHLVIKLRDYYTTSKIYKKVCNKESFDNWSVPIEALEEWDVLLPDTASRFRDLQKIRNEAVHFNERLEKQDRSPALAAIQIMKSIIGDQFGSRPGGSRDWFIEKIPGFSYIKKPSEELPFIKEFYLPACVLVGPFREISFTGSGWLIKDDYSYETKSITDAEFTDLLKTHLAKEK
jgi:hypothetical protein